MSGGAGDVQAVRIRFGRDGDADRLPNAGWSVPESGHTWSVGRESSLTVKCGAFRRRAIFFLSVWPHLQIKDGLTSQRIIIEVNGVPAGRLVTAKAQILAGGIPRQALAGYDTLTIRLRHPDAAKPSDFAHGNQADTRSLGVSYRDILIEEMAPDEARTATSMRAVLRKPEAERALVAAPALPVLEAWREAAAFLPRMQSLGDDCEFGVFQRSLDVEALALLRFSQIGLEDARRGVGDGFARIAEDGGPEIVHVDAPDHDYMARDAAYGLLYHTNRFPGRIDPAVLRMQEARRLRFLARKFREDTVLADQVFVVKRKDYVAAEEVARLFAALRRRGKSRLIWVREAAGGVAAGTAEILAEGLAVAYVDRLDVAPLRNVSVDGWVAACRAAIMVLEADKELGG